MKPVNVLKLLERHFGASKPGARGLVLVGAVEIDGVRIRPCDCKRWTERQLRGRMLTIWSGSTHQRAVRLFGMPPIERLESGA